MTWRVMPVMPVVPPCCGQIHQISDWKHMRWSWSFPFSFKLRSPLPWIFEMSWNVLNPDRIHVLQMQSPLHSRTRCKDPLHLLSTCWMKNDGMDCVCFFFSKLLLLAASARASVLLVCFHSFDQFLTVSNCRMFLRLARQRSANLVHARTAK